MNYRWNVALHKVISTVPSNVHLYSIHDASMNPPGRILKDAELQFKSRLLLDCLHLDDQFKAPGNWKLYVLGVVEMLSSVHLLE